MFTYWIKVEALLDAPRSSSFGRVPFVERVEGAHEDMLMPQGLKMSGVSSRLFPSQMAELINEGHAADLRQVLPAQYPSNELVAGWIGSSRRHGFCSGVR